MDKKLKNLLGVTVNVENAIQWLKDNGAIGAEWISQTSSAGDWTGVFAVEIEGGLAFVHFSQENRFPYSGFELQTDKEYTFAEGEKYSPSAIKDYITFCEAEALDEQADYYESLAAGMRREARVLRGEEVASGEVGSEE